MLRSSWAIWNYVRGCGATQGWRPVVIPGMLCSAGFIATATDHAFEEPTGTVPEHSTKPVYWGRNLPMFMRLGWLGIRMKGSVKPFLFGCLSCHVNADLEWIIWGGEALAPRCTLHGPNLNLLRCSTAVSTLLLDRCVRKGPAAPSCWDLELTRIF